MKKFKIYFIAILLIMTIFTNCSSKYPSVKTGAIIGGTTGAIAGGLVGVAVSAVNTETVLIIGAIVGLMGAGLGAGTGYVIGAMTEDKEIKEIQESHKYIEDTK